MKNQILLIFIAVLVVRTTAIWGQSTTPTNISIFPLPQLLGYNGTGLAQSLQIRNDFASQPIDFFTAGTGAANRRMRINGSNATEAQTGAPTAGFVGIGPNPNIFSRLTISDAATGTNGGFRTWMRTGVFSYETSDAMYVGLRRQAADRADATIVWSDNPAAGVNGIDVLRFIFTSPPIGGGVGNVNPRSTSSVNGYEFMQMASFPNITNSAGSPVGHVGIGPVFLNNNTIPQNRLHINAEDDLAVFTQITNELGTGQTANDGLRLGYPATTANNLEAQINQRENDRLTLFSNNGERVRVTQIGGLNNGVAFNPGGLANNLTRIGISHNPATPVTRPLSLLHLGYNTRSTAPFINENGWRPWMDVGMYISQESDNVYLGLRREGADDRQDAVLSWGDNQTATSLPPGTGPDNFRIIFTSTTNPFGGGTAPANTVNGLEGFRMTPTTNSGIFTGVGGDPTFNLYGPAQNSVTPTNTLEVNSWNNTPILGGSSGLRFTNLNATTVPLASNPGLGLLSVDNNGDVVYVPANNSPNIGNYCPAPQNPLTDNFEIPLGGFSYNFRAGTNDASTVNMGNIPTCGIQFPARLYVRQSEPMGVPFHSAIVGFTEGGALPAAAPSFGIMGFVSQAKSLFHAGVYGASIDADNDIFTANTTGLGVYGTAANNDFNIGVYGVAEDMSANLNIGVWGRATGATVNYAGYFEGDVFVNGGANSGTGFLVASDSLFKTAVDTISNPLSIVSQLKPKSYLYDTANIYGLNFSNKRQYGFIAQEMEQVLPELVSVTNKPAHYDTSGIEISPAVSFRNLNYNSLFGIIVAAMQEQQKQIQNRDSVINNLKANDSILNSRLELLEKCINSLNLCDNSQSMFKQSNSSPSSVTDVRLKDVQTIILNQNVPNPFAEQTLISYFLPDDIKTAEIIFHNLEGKQINRVQIADRGKGEINVYADDLSSGIYTYTLVADGKIADTKRMVKR